MSHLNKMAIALPITHPNKFEHTETAFKFIQSFLICGLAGGLVGQVIDRSVVNLQGDRRGWWSAAAFYTLQILINGLIFYGLFKLIKFTAPEGTLTFDDWISGTFQGLIFATTVYQVQEQISANFKVLI